MSVLNRIGKNQRKIIIAVAKDFGLLKEIGINKTEINRNLKNLADKELVILSGEKIVLSEKGKIILAQIESEDILIQKHEWDGIWRIVAYDIPEERKNEREYFRRKLIQLNFIKIQESMWATPWECKEEIAVFAHSLGLSPFVIFLTTNYLPKEEKYLSLFNIRRKKAV